MNFEELLQNLITWASTEGIKLLLSLLLFFVLCKVANGVAKRLNKMLVKRKAEKTIIQVSTSVTRKVIKILAFVIFLGSVGVQTTSITAVIASLGVAIGLALQGSLSNLAAGILILVTRPFKVGDYVEIAGKGGTVEEIELFNTFLTTIDNKVVVIPNSNVTKEVIVNFSKKNTRRVDMTFSIGYGDDYQKARQLILQCVEQIGLALPEEEVLVNISKHASSCVDVLLRVWVKSEDYWTMHFALLEEVKKSFDQNGITIPYQQVQVHIEQK